jgi:hypothetical protein
MVIEDSVEWKFLKKALSSFNFGPFVCKWFELFYSKAKSCVINNGHMSIFFSLDRGCRQGDPLSPYSHTAFVLDEFIFKPDTL